MTRTLSLSRLGLVAVLAGAAIAACSSAPTASPSAAPSSAPSLAPESAAPSASMAAESPSESGAVASPSASAAASAAPAGSPEARVVQVQAFEGGFMNAPADPLPGTILTFRNVGVEAHEMIVVRRNDDATEAQTFEDPTTLNPAALLSFVTVVGVLAADPGQEATGQIELTEPGDYAIVDMLAKGTMTAPASPDPLAIPSGVPNLLTGLFATFTVLAPEAS